MFACYPIAANVKGWGCVSFCKSSYSQTCCFVGRRQLASCCFARSSSFPFNPHGDVSTCLQLDLSLLLFIAWIIWWAGRPKLIKCRNLILNIQGCNWFDPKLSHVVHFLRERHAKMLSLLPFFASDAMRYIFRHDICPFLYTEGFSAQKFPP